jgi:type IV secretion system protein VirD4
MAHEYDYDIVLGRAIDNDDVLRLPGGEHAILQARSGAGKSVGGSIPNAFTWPGSLVCLDIKRELFQFTAGWRRKQGHQVYLFDPAAEDGRSHRWNPFWQVDRQSLERFDQISRMAFQIWPEALGSGDKNQNFWSGAAREAFCAVTGLIAETPSEPLTMANVLRVFLRGDNSWLRQQITARRLSQEPYSRGVVDGIAGYIGGDKLQREICKTVTTSLQIWSNPRVAAATSETDFDLREIRRKRMSIYVGVSPGDVPRNAPLLRLFFDALLSVNTSKTPQQDPTLAVPVLLMLDEFAQLGRMDRLSHALEYVRGYGLRLFLIVQNKPQIADVYGPNAAKSIFDNVGVEMMYGTNDEVLAKQYEERMGDDTVPVTTTNRPRWFPSLSPSKQADAVHPHRRPLMLRQEILQMPGDEMLIMRPGMRPIRAKKIRWWEEPEFIDRQTAPPVIPELVIVVPMDDGLTPLPQPPVTAMQVTSP